MLKKRQVKSIPKTSKIKKQKPTLTLEKDVDKGKLPGKLQNCQIGPVIQVRKTKQNELEYHILNKPDQKGTQSSNKPVNINHCTLATPTLKTITNLPENVIKKKNVDKWKCFICKRKPDELAMGDLYGPYVFVNENYVFFQPDSSITSTANLKEIWLHEDCVVWLPNVLLFQDRLLNFDSAMKELISVQCAHCLKKGASIRCCHRNCSDSAFHFPCARELNCYFDESTFTVYCRKHHKALMKG